MFCSSVLPANGDGQPSPMSERGLQAAYCNGRILAPYLHLAMLRTAE